MILEDELLDGLGHDFFLYLLYFEVTFCDKGPRDRKDVESRDIALNLIAYWREFTKKHNAELNGDLPKINERIKLYESWLDGRENYENLVVKLRSSD